MTLSQAILATLAYHDIFDYPLKEDEIHRYLIAAKSGANRVQKELTRLKSERKIGESQGYHYLRNRVKIITTRFQRAKYSQVKLKRAKLFSKLLTLIPTLQLVAVSGALAMENSHQRDDIDLVLITSRGSLWTTRFFANIILSPFKRKPASNRVNNRACLNLFLDVSDLKIRPQNLYTAHEICQMKPLWNRNKTYSQFIRANSWVKKFLPNWRPDAGSLTHNAKGKSKNALVVSRLALSIENLLKSFQLWYMRPKMTTERIGKTQLFFHPINTQEWVMGEYNKSLIKLGISNGKTRK